MINKLKQEGRLQISTLLIILCCICFSLSVFRYFYSETKNFLFLNWNLFLAFVPWVCSSLLIMNKRLQKSKATIVAMLFIWLLFFPNAPYILTDLFHLRLRTNMPIWFDLVLIISYAWTGLLLGYISLFDIEKVLGKYMSQTKITILSVGMLFLGSFGIYLGRFLRWNSWDIISEPMELFYDIGQRFTNPFEHPRTWGVTIFMGLLLTMIYFSLKVIRSEK